MIIVGRPNAAAYGGSTDTIKLAKGPGLLISPDPSRCTDADGRTLEGQSVNLDVEEDLSPIDLANGPDTGIEKAVAALKK